ncbi:ribonuclease H-like domain-containing protein [Natrinema halophilum]|uniref:Ribonuclease H-like domain-containing protein n=1 Tax=Natrinema halophilum TaxID=1699371 RepID=A0A7D5H1P3_9EURY|nr:ribonuclease H-like domain-containing protein [Natrinema halophilum]QLG48451.1 ribonuclease H-like domain-containing protein [Natrinema halophilum]
MTAGMGAELLALRCDAVADFEATALRDVLEYFDPDLVYVARDRSDIRVVSRIRRAFDGPVVFAGGSADVRTETVAGVSFAFSGTASLLEDLNRIEAAPDGSVDPSNADFVVCDDLRPTTDAVALSASLDGCDVIARYQSRADSPTTFLTGALEASYDHVWAATVGGDPVRLPVRGVAPLRRSGGPELACLTCDREGSVSVSSVPADRFGLQALSRVGPTTADRLRTSGYDTRTAVAEATEAELRSVEGIGASTARDIAHSARSLTESRVIRPTDEPIPPASQGATPVFVDIETDGLQPTVLWLIGVYDPVDDAYVDFVDTEPTRDDPGAATRKFVSWLAAEYESPSLVAWNGHAFDYPHLERFISRYAPEYREYWAENVSTYDLYDWAVRRDNAVLPGRTNRLEAVADALGRDRSGPAAALDGKSLAERIRRLLEETGTPATGPDDDRDAAVPSIDWDAARTYCEADVRELAAVYDAIENAPVETTGNAGDPGRSPSDGTTQTGLADF